MNMKIRESKILNSKAVLLYAMCISFLFILICSKSSFLYPMNDWQDANCFFTVGKAMMNGKVLYKDIYEQKGPVLYFIHGIAYLISKTSFFGVFLIEVISVGMFLYISAKCAVIYLNEKKLVYFLIPVLVSVITMSKAFAHGDSVEELSLVLVMYSLYTVLSNIRRNEFIKTHQIILNGVCAALILWMKFTLLGFYIGLVIFVSVWYLGEKEVKKWLNAILYFLLGVAVVSVPVLLYALLTHSIKDLFGVYFYNNIFLYPYELQESRLLVIRQCVTDMLKDNKCFSVFLIAGFVYPLKKTWKEWLCIWGTGICMALGTYWGGRAFVYYGLIFSVYAVFGLIAFLNLLTKCKMNWVLKPYKMQLALILICIMLLGINYYRSDNTYLLGVNKQEMPQYRFAEIINNVSDAKILNYGFMDGGFYFAANKVPVNKFFCRLNIPLEALDNEQNQYVEEGKVDFVITRDTTLKEWKVDDSRYECIEQAEYYYEGVIHKYYLYQLKK